MRTLRWLLHAPRAVWWAMPLVLVCRTALQPRSNPAPTPLQPRSNPARALSSQPGPPPSHALEPRLAQDGPCSWGGEPLAACAQLLLGALAALAAPAPAHASAQASAYAANAVQAALDRGTLPLALQHGHT